MIRILSQRNNLVDSADRMNHQWFDFFAGWVKSYNKRMPSFSGTRYELTGTTDATEATSSVVQMGSTGRLLLTIATSSSSNLNAKTVTVKLGGQLIATLSVATNTESQSASLLVCGRGASSQYVSAVALTNMTMADGGATTADISGNSTLSVELQLGTSTDTIALEMWALDVEQA